MKLYNKIIVCVVLVTTFFIVNCLSVFGASRQIYDYNDFVYDFSYDGDTKNVVLSLPLDSCTYGFRDSNKSWTTGTGSSLRYVYSNFGNYASINFNFYPLGGALLDAYNIPQDTIITYKTEISYRVDETSQLGHVFGDCKGYATALDSTYSVITNNISANKPISVNAGTGRYYNETIDVVSTFHKNSNTDYMEPQFGFSFWADGTSSGIVTFDVSVVEITLTMSINALWEQQQSSGKTNELLETLINGTPEGAQIAEDMKNKQNQVEDKAENMLGELEVDKPSVDFNTIDTSGVNALGFLWNDKSRTMILIYTLCYTTLGIASIGYVLHGKR